MIANICGGTVMLCGALIGRREYVDVSRFVDAIEVTFSNQFIFLVTNQDENLGKVHEREVNVNYRILFRRYFF